MKHNHIRRLIVVMIALVMMLASGVPVLADGKGKGYGNNNGKGKGNHHHNWQTEWQDNWRGSKHNGQIPYKLDFDDVDKDAKWAQKYIASLAAKKVFEGYTDGTFQPNKPVTRIEAVVAAVRLMGLREEAEDKRNWEKDIEFDDEKQIRFKHNWAVGYVVAAEEAGLFDGSDKSLQPQKAADRLWVTELLIKALDLEAEAEASMGAKLDFKDRDDIPNNKVGYVKVALDKGIITGYANGTFKPEKPVSRAELAAMLERMEEKLPDKGNDTEASGVIVSDVKNGALMLRQDGVVSTYSLDPNAFVFRDGKKATAGSLEVGDTVFIRSYNQLVIFVEVLETAEEAAKPFTIGGVVESMTFDSRGRMTTITISDDGDSIKYEVSSKVKINGDTDELKRGRIVELEGEDDVVTTITIGDQTFRVEGKLEYVTLNSNGQIATIAIRHTVNGNSQTTIYSVSPDVKISGNPTLLGEGQDIVLSGSHHVITDIVIDD